MRGSRSIPDQVNILEGPSKDQTIPAETTAPALNTGINKRFLKPLRIIILVLAVVFAVFLLLNFISRPFDKTNNRFSSIKVLDGEDLLAVSETLEESGIVMDASAFRLVSKVMFLTDFKPGTYYLSPSMNSVDIARTMVNGLTITNGFTIPEGYTLEQIASSLSRDGFADKEAFLKAASDPSLREIEFIGKGVKGSRQVEGFLFPGDYHVDPHADETMLIFTMLDGFSNFFNEDMQARADELEMSIRDIIVIASLIENETSIENEMPKISAVIHNRISLGLADKKEVPKIPLCSPGEDAVIAALYPAESEDTYYVLSAKLDGSHVFTSDEDEYTQLLKDYNEAVRKRDAERRREH